MSWQSIQRASIACIAMVLTMPNCKADNIDDSLLRHGFKIVSAIKDSGYEAVGVLPFRVKRPGAAPSFGVGLINHNLADRLENALVLGMDPNRPPFAIAVNATETSFESLSSPNYRDPQARSALFGVRYQTLEGSTSFVDAFLTGKATFSETRDNVRLEIEVFDAENPEVIRDVAVFDVPTDDFILSDSSMTFTGSKGNRSFSRGISDDDIISGSLKRPGGSASSKSGSSSEPSKKVFPFPLDVQVLYDGQRVSPQKDMSNPGPYNYVLPDPKEGESVTFRVKNLTPETLGVVLAVNGVSTLYGDKGQPDQMTRWVFPAGKQYLIKGFHNKDDRTFKSIVGLSDEESAKRFEDFGGRNAGLIHVYVFRKSDEDASIASESAPPTSTSLRNTTQLASAKESGKKFSVADLQSLIRKSSGVKASRGLMTIGKDGNEDLKKLPLGPSKLARTMVIRYYRPPTTSPAASQR